MLVHDKLTVLHLSDEELRAGKPSIHTIQDGLEALHRDGMVVIDNAVSHEHVDAVHSVMSQDTDRLMAGETGGPHFNQGDETRNLNQVPPLRSELLFNDVYANPFAVPIIAAYLGPKPELRFTGSAVLFPGGVRQKIHADLEYPYLSHPFSVAVNVPLEDITEENGATELMLGTHRDSSIDLHTKDTEPWIRPELVKEAERWAPKINPPLLKGSLAIRDLRMWHSGVENKSDRPRPLLGLLWFASWYGNQLRLKMPKSAQKVIEGWTNHDDITVVADYMDEPFDYLSAPFSANYSQERAIKRYYERKAATEHSFKATGVEVA